MNSRHAAVGVPPACLHAPHARGLTLLPVPPRPTSEHTRRLAAVEANAKFGSAAAGPDTGDLNVSGWQRQWCAMIGPAGPMGAAASACMPCQAVPLPLRRPR